MHNFHHGKDSKGGMLFCGAPEDILHYCNHCKVANVILMMPSLVVSQG